MKTKILAAVAMSAVLSAQATLYTYDFTSGFANGGVIPDGNVTGWSDTRNVPNSFTLGANDTSEIVDVDVRLNISGGYNGDLYGYLVHDNGFVVLLNRIGRTSTDAFGNSGAGMNVTLDDDSGTDIHLASSGFLTGTYNPDGRTQDPMSVLDSDTPSTFLDSFDGGVANGNWTLFLSDMAGGDVSTVLNWGLDISVVPEPVNVALGGFAALIGGVQFIRWRRARKFRRA
jgi:subtilisin-like proprotein convertase family protein